MNRTPQLSLGLGRKRPLPWPPASFEGHVTHRPTLRNAQAGNSLASFSNERAKDGRANSLSTKAVSRSATNQPEGGEAAKRMDMKTIAERVEDTNTMAVLSHRASHQ